MAKSFMHRGVTESNFSLKVCDCENPTGTEIEEKEVTVSFKIMLAIAAILIIAIGIYPEFVVGWMYH